jgi:glycosyltransferase involved in cell wall biosynthesis
MTDRSKQPPFVSVIIPTFNRKDSLLRTLEILGRQTYPAEMFEVIVVDDGGTDGTKDVKAQPFPFTLHYVRQTNQGAAVARNTGAHLAQGEVLVFLDDDITVVPEFVGSLACEFSADQRIVVVGSLKPPLREGGNTFRALYAVLLASDERREIDFAACLSAILAVRREDFYRIGKMQDVAGDPRTAWGDVDFGYRAHQLGFSFRRSLDAIGYHDDRAIENLETYCRVQERASMSAVLLFQKYPPLQASIPMFRDKGPIAWRADRPALIARKLARQIVSSPPVLCAVEKLVRALEAHYRSPGVLARLYRSIIGAYMYKGFRQGLQELKAGRSG